VERKDWVVVDLDEVVADVLTLVGGAFRQKGIAVLHRRSTALRTRGDRGRLGQALAQLLTSLRAAAVGGGNLTIEGGREGGRVALHFTMAAGTVRVGRDEWMALGMGFWGARQVFAEHSGQLAEPEIAEAGEHTDEVAAAVWTVVLPEAWAAPPTTTPAGEGGGEAVVAGRLHVWTKTRGRASGTVHWWVALPTRVEPPTADAAVLGNATRMTVACADLREVRRFVGNVQRPEAVIPPALRDTIDGKGTRVAPSGGDLHERFTSRGRLRSSRVVPAPTVHPP
jgi:hypothetical protein